MAKRIIGAALLALAVGCGVREAHETPAPDAARFERVEKRVRELEESISRHAARAEQKTDDAARAAKADLNDLEARHAGSIRRIESLESAVKNLSAELKTLKRQPLTAAAAPVAEPQSARLPPEFFPVSVSGVTGRTFVTGTHLTTQDVETDEVYRDEFGNRAKRTRSEVVEANQYGYQAAFSVENLTDEPVEVTVGAGALPRTLSVPPRGAARDVTVDWIPGSSLSVTAGGRKERFKVPWHPEAGSALLDDRQPSLEDGTQ